MYACIIHTYTCLIPSPTPARYLYHRCITPYPRLPMSKATAKTVVHACPVLYIQESCSCMCVHMQHAWQPTTFCSHDLHISCFPEGIMTDGHLGAPPAWPYTFLYVEKERDFFFLFLFVFWLPIEPVNFFVEMGLKIGKFPSRLRIERLSWLYGPQIFVLFSLSVEIIDRPFIIRLLPPRLWNPRCLDAAQTKSRLCMISDSFRSTFPLMKLVCTLG